MKIAFAAADIPDAQSALETLTSRYGHMALEEADIVVALGGDGFMLETLHRCVETKVAVYGMNRGSIGFLMNGYAEDALEERLAKATQIELHPLTMSARTLGGEEVTAIAFNEVSLLRETGQTAKIRISIDDVERMAELICDGVLVATPAGSTAYNLSAHGTILPIGAGLLALTPISAFRPRRWRGALLPEQAKVCLEVLEADKRPVAAVADSSEVRDVQRVDIRQSKHHSVTLLYDPEHNLEERIIREQFQP